MVSYIGSNFVGPNISAHSRLVQYESRFCTKTLILEFLDVEPFKMCTHPRDFGIRWCSEVVTRLRSGVDVAAVGRDLSIKCEEFSSFYPWKMAICSTEFWIGETGSGPTNTRSAWDKHWVNSYVALMIRCTDADTSRPETDLKTPQIRASQ